MGVRGGEGVRGWWKTWCKCCSGLESLNCTEIGLLLITLLLSAESKANSPKHIRRKMEINTTDLKCILHNCHNFFFIYITTLVDVQIQ